MNHKRKEKGKGKDTESPHDRDPSTGDIGLSSANITSLLANNPTRSEQCEHTVKLIHNQAKEKLTIKIPAQGKPGNPPPAGTGTEMDVDDHTPSTSQ